MSLSLEPGGDDRMLVVRHDLWGLDWNLQFPETITAEEGEFMSWPANCHPLWESLKGRGWGYTWRPQQDYSASVLALECRDAEGNPQHECFIRGLALRAEAITSENVLALSLRISNEGRDPVHELACDGGCWQANNEAFAGEGEVHRSYIRCSGDMVPMGKLPRSIGIRCMYHAEPSRYNPSHEWFWGKSSVSIDQPAVVGMCSRDGSKALVFSYEGSDSALANADHHHCLHSRPWFGTLLPGESKTRRGYIVFGEDVNELADQLDAFME